MKKSKVRNIVAWVIQVLMGLEFIIAGQAKFTRTDWWSRKFDEWGYPDNFYFVIGGVEILGAILIFFPSSANP